MGGVCSLISFQFLWENLPTSGGGGSPSWRACTSISANRARLGGAHPPTPPLLPHPQATLGEPGASVEMVSQEEESERVSLSLGGARREVWEGGRGQR